MRTIYIDKDFKCHVANDGTMEAVETFFFDGKCDFFVEGYHFVPSGKSWIREDGEIFSGEMIAPWKDYSELDSIQRVYEQNLIVQYEAELAELDAAILEIQYQNLVEGL